MTPAGRPAGTSRDMARRVVVSRSSSARRIAVFAAVAGLAGVALIGMMHPLFAAGGSQPSASATLGAIAGVGTVWGTSTDTGGGIDWIDLITKGSIVLALLYITLRVLGRNGVGTKKRGGRLEILESRSLAGKASLHLVAVGDRRLVVGLTPSGMVSLAELDAAELETEEAATDPAALGIPNSLAAEARPVRPVLGSVGTLLWPLDAIANRLSLLLNGGRAR
jgi:flagellar biogenesis protein FliO